MLIINTSSDLTSADSGAERTAFLKGLLNDYITFDDAVYPQDYNRDLQPSDAGYVKPVLRKEWNKAAAAFWGFNSQDEVSAAM